ncbi:hypothetical protein B0H14DRAFT_2571231 [Mycena olivaceomarginata]|nr:hypothetical protein B0H14DRAFT_2571231 [Mycena olivaceomarginata]
MSVKLNFWLDSIQSSKLLCPFKYKCIIYSSVRPKVRSQESTILPFEEGVQHTASQKCTDNEHASSKKRHSPRSSRAWSVVQPPDRGAQCRPTGYASSMVLSKAILYVKP